MSQAITTKDQPKNTWAQATVVLPARWAEAVSEALMENGALSVTIEDAQADTEDEQALFGEPGLEPETTAWNQNRVLALFNNQTEGQTLIDALPYLWLENADVVWSSVPEQDWVRLTQSQFEPIAITEKLWIVPSWHTCEANNHRINLRLDPGLAFGTGSHPTTDLCLQWLSQTNLEQTQILDYGCGSGILAIAALKLGAAHAVAVDIDPQAVQSAANNAVANEVNLITGLPEHEAAQGLFPVVLANILSNPLKILAPNLCARVATGGWLVLSGILERQAEDLIAAYAPWIKMHIWQTQEGWVCLVGQKTNSETAT